jgi:DHA1 family bicyclomycin/chloramphenicol resistance-like MFS transporter
VLFCVASLACAAAPSIEFLAGGRMLQGMAAGSQSGLLVAMVRDRTSGAEAARVQSWLLTVMMVSPILAPLIGSGILLVTSWRWTFVLLAAYAAVSTLVIATSFRETLAAERRRTGDVWQAFRGLRLIRDRSFMVPALAVAISSGAFMAYLAGSSPVLQGAYGLSAQAFAALFSLNAVGIMLTTALNRRLLRRFAPHQIMVGGMVATSAASIALLAGAGLAPDVLVAIAVPLAALVASWTLIQPNAVVVIMHDHADNAGAASSSMRLIQATLGAAVAPLAGLGAASSALPLAILIATLSLTGLVATVVLLRRSSFAGAHRMQEASAVDPAQPVG